MRNVKRISFVALLLLVIGLTGSLFTYSSIAKSEPVKEESIFNEAITNIHVETGNSKIEILPATDERTIVEFLDTSKSRYNLEAEVENGTLRVEMKQKALQIFNFDFNWKPAVTKVYLPEKTYDFILAKTKNGEVMIENISVNSLEGKSTNGNITLKNLHTEEVTTKTVNGKINMEAVEGKLQAKATNGRISLETANIDQQIDFETVNGKINIQVNEKPENAEIEVEVVNGSVNIFGDKNHHTIIGNGENKIKLTTVNGSIKVGN